ncbi:MAG TPA: hypothetical protein VNQ73_16190 [Ilumatobacter sp.]|nr:hypothetical protein [Ilumatobacter sp.]
MRARQLIVRCLTVACVLVAANAALVPGPVSFAGGRGSGDGGDGGGGGGGEINEDGDPTATASDPGTPDTEETTPGSGGGDPECWWEVYVEDDTAVTVFGMAGTRLFSETGRWLMRICEDLGPVMVDGWSAVPEEGLVIPGELAAEASESIPIGAPFTLTSPAAGRLVVQVPTWLWIDGDWWHDYSATATAGRVSATVTATPISAVWSTGDGTTVECGAGTPWQRGLAESEATCSHTYRSVSPAGGFDLSVTVEIEVTWTSNVGEAGTLPTINRSAAQAVQVGEIQAIGTG